MDQTETGDPLVSHRMIVNGIETTATLTDSGQLQWSGRCLALEKELLGFSIEGSRIKLRTLIESEGGICCLGSSGVLVRKTFVFETLSEDTLQIWSQKLQEHVNSFGRPKRLFILVNPFGGKKSASKIFIDDVKLLLEDADIDFTAQETKYQLHAREVVQTLDLSKYDGIVCVSGDGILVEVVNGLLLREDWSIALKMPIGVVPAGTGNGMVKSLLDAAGEPCTVFNAIRAIIRGQKRPLDVATLLQGETRFFSVLMLAWGLVADIDIESEKYRWMGSARIDFYALQRILSLRKYNGCISFVPAPGFEAFGELCSPTNESTDKQKVGDIRHCYRGPDVDLNNLSWRKINGPFVSVWLHNVPWGGEDTMAAPDAKLSDGCLDLLIIRDCPKLSLLTLMTELNEGGHVKSPHVLYLKVKAFMLEPGAQVEDSDKEGIIDVDGEVLARGRGTYKYGQRTLMAYEKLQITVDQGLATLFSPP